MFKCLRRFIMKRTLALSFTLFALANVICIPGAHALNWKKTIKASAYLTGSAASLGLAGLSAYVGCKSWNIGGQILQRVSQGDSMGRAGAITFMISLSTSVIVSLSTLNTITSGILGLLSLRAGIKTIQE